MQRLSKFTVLAVLAPYASIVAAQAPERPIELWNGFTTASTKAEIKAFKATKPKQKIELIPGCIAEMGHVHKDGQTVTIIFLGQDRDANCFARMFADYRSRLGVPETRATSFGGGYGDGQGGGVISVSEGTMFVWREGIKRTQIVKSPGNGYNLIFTVRPEKYLY